MRGERGPKARKRERERERERERVTMNRWYSNSSNLPGPREQEVTVTK